MIFGWLKTDTETKPAYHWEQLAAVKWRGDNKKDEFMDHWNHVESQLPSDMFPKNPTLRNAFYEAIRDGKSKDLSYDLIKYESDILGNEDHKDNTLEWWKQRVEMRIEKVRLEYNRETKNRNKESWNGMNVMDGVPAFIKGMKGWWRI